jgi:hypothetical protein
LQKFFLDAFDGVRVRDFWAPYDALTVGDHQCSLVHLLRELEKVDKHNQSDTWQAFAKKLRRMVRDGIRLRKRADFTPEAYRSRIQCLDRRLIEMAEETYDDSDAQRLAKRLSKYRQHLHVPGLRERAVREQPRRTPDPAGSGAAQEQPIGSQRTRRGDAVGADERVPHVEAQGP